MTINKKNITGLAFVLMTVHCGPEARDEAAPEPKETIAAFCKTLFACPEAEAMAYYGSQEGCEDVHLRDYEQRDQVCQDLVLALEECLASLSCQELSADDCDEGRLRLGEEACAPL